MALYGQNPSLQTTRGTCPDTRYSAMLQLIRRPTSASHNTFEGSVLVFIHYPFKFLCADAVYSFFSRTNTRRTGFPSSTHCCLTASTRKPDIRAITRISPAV